MSTKTEINKILSEAIRRVKKREKNLCYTDSIALTEQNRNYNKGITASIRSLVQLQKEFNKNYNENN